MMFPRMMTINEAAAESGLAAHFIRQLVLTGRLPSIKAGKKYLIADVNLSKLLCDGTSPPSEPPHATKGIRRIV